MTGDITILAPPPPGYPNLNNDTSNTTFIDIVWDSSNFMFSPVIYQVSLVLSRFGTNVPVMSPHTVCAVCNILSIIVYVHYISLPLPSLSLSLFLSLSLSLSPSPSPSPSLSLSLPPSPFLLYRYFKTMHRFQIRCSQQQSMLQ